MRPSEHCGAADTKGLLPVGAAGAYFAANPSNAAGAVSKAPVVARPLDFVEPVTYTASATSTTTSSP